MQKPPNNKTVSVLFEHMAHQLIVIFVYGFILTVGEPKYSQISLIILYQTKQKRANNHPLMLV